jgi:hypothetical protein
MLEESLIFRNPKVLQEHLWNLRQIDPVVEERTLSPAREHRARLLDHHRQRPRRIDKSHHRHLDRWDEKKSHEQDQHPFFPSTA